ncbi:MAG: YncE family protein [Chloroflexi bacterium]|nr:YncE family protein [Chloroflexota bacterium]
MNTLNRSSHWLALGLTIGTLVLLVVLATGESTWAEPNAQGTVPPPPYFLYLPIVLKNASPPPIPPSANGFWVAAPNGLVSALDHLFVASKTSNRVAIWDENAPGIVKWVGVGSQPWGVGFVNGRVFVANFGSATVSVIDAVTLNKVTDVNLASACAGSPANIAVSPLTSRVYVAMYGIGRVAVISALDNSLIECIATNKLGTFGVAVNWITNELYVTSRDAMNLQVWNIGATPATLAQDWDLGGSPYSVQWNPNNNQVYFTVAFDPPDYALANNVYSFDPASGLPPAIFTIVGNTDDGGAIVVSQATGNLYIAATADNQLWVINPTTYAFQTIAMPDPLPIAENVGLGRMYIGNRSAGWVNIQSNAINP